MRYDNTVSVLLNTTAPGATTPSFATQQTFATGSDAELGDGGRHQRRRQARPDRGESKRRHGVGAAQHHACAGDDFDANSFATQQTFATGSDPVSVTAADLNGDGKPDLIVANENGNTVSVLLNTTAPGATTPSFAAQQTFATGSGPVSVTAADVNGDGKPDLIVANQYTTTRSRCCSTPPPRAPPPPASPPSRPSPRAATRTR